MTDIEYFSRIDGDTGFAGSQVAFGGSTADAAMPWLKDEGFACVINLRLANEEGVDIGSARSAAEAAGLKYIHLPFDPRQPAPGLVDEFLSVVTRAENQPAYIHCRTATRVAALWVIGRVLVDDWAFDAACREGEPIAYKPADAMAFADAYLRHIGAQGKSPTPV